MMGVDDPQDECIIVRCEKCGKNLWRGSICRSCYPPPAPKEIVPPVEVDEVDQGRHYKKKLR